MVAQSEAKIRSCENGGIESNDLKTGAISKHGLDVETIGSCVGWMLGQESTLDVDTNVHVLLSNIELRQKEWRNRCKYWTDDNRRGTDH